MVAAICRPGDVRYCVGRVGLFVQGGNGAVFAKVPTINRRSAGQIAGMVGAYGNVGGLILSSVLFFTISPTHRVRNVPLVFLVIAGSALAMAALCRFLPSEAPAVIDESAELDLAAMAES